MITHDDPTFCYDIAIKLSIAINIARRHGELIAENISICLSHSCTRNKNLSYQLIYNGIMQGIEIKNLFKTYEDGVKALRGVSVHFKKNKISGLIGFNGSGKTTTFNILANFIEKYKGNVLFDGKTIREMDLSEISYLAAGIESKSITKAKKHLMSIAYIYGMNKKIALKRIHELAHFLDFSQHLNKFVKFLSKGNKQKIKLIACFLNPNLKYLLLDEPFDGIDPIIVKKIIQIFKKLKNITTIITSHRMEIVDQVCDEYFILKMGKIVDKKIVDNQNIVIEVNKEVDVENFKNKKGVLEVMQLDNYNLILIEDISHFKNINIEIVKKSNYIYSSIRNKNLAASVFEAYK